MLISSEREQSEARKGLDFNAKHNFLLLARKDNDVDQIECLLISDGKLKEHFKICRDNDFYRTDIFCAREFLGEEKEITSEIVMGFDVILEVINAKFFFTDFSKGRNFDQIAKQLFAKYMIKGE